MRQHVKRVDSEAQNVFECAIPVGRNILYVRRNRITCKFQGATIIIRVESESRSKTIVASSSDFSYTCAGLSRRSVALYLPGIPLNGAILGERNLCRTRRMTRHVAAVSYTMADLFAVHRGSPCTESLDERTRRNKADLSTNWAPKFGKMFLLSFSLSLSRAQLHIGEFNSTLVIF